MSDFSVMTMAERDELKNQVREAQAAAANAMIHEMNMRSALKAITKKPLYDRFGACLFCNTHKSFGCRPDCVFVAAVAELADKNQPTRPAGNKE